MRTMMISTMRWWLLALLVLTVSCQKKTEETPADKTETSLAAVVDTVTLNTTSFTEYIDLTGVTEPIRAASLAPEVPGRITHYDLKPGEHVDKGELLVSVDVGQQSAQIAQLKAQLKQLDADIGRTEGLLARGLASKKQLEQLKTQRATTYQSMRSVRIGVRNARIRSPFAGVVLEENSELGEYAAPGEVIARVGDLTTIKVMVNLPESELRYVHKDDAADVSIPALGETFQGQVTRIGMEADAVNRTFPVEIHIPNPKGEIRAGMRADALLHKARIEQAIVVPRDVLRPGSKGPEAVVVENGKAVVRSVTTGSAYARYVVVLSGLKVGDKLVIRGQRDLISGEEIQPNDEGSCCRAQLAAVRAKAGLPASDAVTAHANVKDKDADASGAVTKN